MAGAYYELTSTNTRVRFSTWLLDLIWVHEALSILDWNFNVLSKYVAYRDAERPKYNLFCHLKFEKHNPHE